jgi:RNA polymerase sigma-70 factor, ECF subfamily
MLSFEGLPAYHIGAMKSKRESEAARHAEAVHALFIRHSPEVRGFILALLPDMSRADDVFQETFMTVSRKSADFELGTNFLGWVCSIARYKVKEAWRLQPGKLQPLTDEVIEALCATEPAPTEVEEAQLKALAACLGELPSHTQRAVELRYQHAHKPPEIARLLGWSVASVYVVLSRARTLLRECVGRALKAQQVRIS